MACKIARVESYTEASGGLIRWVHNILGVLATAFACCMCANLALLPWYGNPGNIGHNYML